MPAAENDTRFNFTEARIRDWPTPTAGRVRLKDAGCPGLAVYVTPMSRVYYFRSKVDGRSVEVRLGVWPALTVEEARAKVKGTKTGTSIAADPGAVQKAKRDLRRSATLTERWERLLASPYRVKDGEPLRDGTIRSYRESWKLLESIGAWKPEQATHEEVQTLRHRLEKAHGPSSTRRALALLSILLPLGLPKDPKGRRRSLLPKIEPRRRFLKGWELGAFLRGLDAEPPLWRMFWICALVAPLRRGNLAAARWTEVHLDEPGQERWEVPSERAKGGKRLDMPIAAPLANLLREWRRQVPGEVYLFPAGATGALKPGSTHIVNPLHAWRRALFLGTAWRMCEALAVAEGGSVAEGWARFRASLEAERIASWVGRAAPGEGVRDTQGKPLERCVSKLADRCRALRLDPEVMRLSGITPHDLRRTAGSWAVQGGASMAIVSAALGHSDQRVTQQHYGHLNDKPVRDLMNSNAALLMAGMPEGSMKAMLTAGKESQTKEKTP